MPARLSHADQLAQIHELNRLFLHFLRERADAGADCLGLAPAVVTLLRYAEDAALEAAAQFPRALFDLDTREPARGTPVDVLETAASRSRQALNLTVLLCAWNMSRESDYRARLFLGLGRAAVHRLRTTPLSELPRLALAPRVLTCAFPRFERFWRELLGDTRPEVRQRLALIALQPGLEHDWPTASAAAGRYASN